MNNFRIVGGTDAAPRTWRWIVQLDRIGCSGTIIDEHFVLTAAHCCQIEDMNYYGFYANKYLRSDVGAPVRYQLRVNTCSIDVVRFVIANIIQIKFLRNIGQNAKFKNSRRGLGLRLSGLRGPTSLINISEIIDYHRKHSSSRD